MKKSILGVVLVFASSFAVASPTPIKEDLTLKNEKFSSLIYQALEKKIPAVRTGAVSTVEIKGLIKCKSIVGFAKISHSCTLAKYAWNSLGDRDIYSSGDKAELTKKLYDGLGLKVIKEEGLSMKSIELNVPDQHGGTERNLLTCARPSKELQEMGFRETCQLIDGM